MQHSRSRFLTAFALLLALSLGCAQAFGSYAIYVGKNLSADGSVLIGGSGDEVSSHWLEIVPGGTHPVGSTV
ncbi:MAG: hypothetical protein OEW27_18390, partial [Aquincola sp.]|nr:hypothetical protein [Aquincola sp.]